MPRVRRRTTTPAVAVAAATATTVRSSNGSLASGSARRTSGITAIASPRRTTPRMPGMRPTAPRTRGLGPDPTAIVPSALRTAAAQCSRPWTSRPLRSAMPPRRSLASATEELLRDVAIAVRGEAEVGDRDALVARVHQRPDLVEAHLALGEEAVRDALREGGAEGARVGEGRKHRGHDARLRFLPREPAAQ